MDGSRCDQYTWLQTPRSGLCRSVKLEACSMAWPKLEEADLKRLEVKSRDGEEGKEEVHRRRPEPAAGWPKGMMSWESGLGGDV